MNATSSSLKCCSQIKASLAIIAGPAGFWLPGSRQAKTRMDTPHGGFTGTSETYNPLLH